MIQNTERIQELSIDNHHYNCLRLYSLLAYPEDQEKRKQLEMVIRLSEVRNLDTAERLKFVHKNPEYVQVLLKMLDYTWEDSLFKTLSEGIKNYNKSITAGNILLITLALGMYHGQFSISKAKWLLQEIMSGKKCQIMFGKEVQPFGLSNLGIYWKDFKSVSPLSAAVSLVGGAIISDMMNQCYQKKNNEINVFSREELECFCLAVLPPYVSSVGHFFFFNEKLLDRIINLAETLREAASTISPQIKLPPYLDDSAWKVIPVEGNEKRYTKAEIIGPLLPERLKMLKDYKAKVKTT